MKGNAAMADWKVNQDRIARWTDIGSSLDQSSKRELKSLLKGVKPHGGSAAVVKGLGLAGLSFLPLLTKNLRGDSKEVATPAVEETATNGAPVGDDANDVETPLPVSVPTVSGESDVPDTLPDVVQDTAITSQDKQPVTEPVTPVVKPVTPTTRSSVSKQPDAGSIDWSGYATPMSIGGLLGAGLGGLLGGDRDADEEAYDKYGRRVKKKGPFSRTTGALLGGAAGAGLGALYKNIYG